MKTGIELITEERQRQIDVEGWTLEHDFNHKDNSIAKAAACYAMPEDERKKYESFTFQEPKRWYPRWWPKSWDVSWWKPSTDGTKAGRIKELQKAGALIAAEIDRLQNEKIK